MLRARATLVLLLILFVLLIVYITEPGFLPTPDALTHDTDSLLFLGALLIACAVVLRQLRKLQHHG